MTEQKTTDGAGKDAVSGSPASTPPGFQPLSDTTTPAPLDDRLLGETPEQRGISLYFIIGGTIIVLLFLALTGGLYLLGGEDQSALERLRDIAVIYIVFMSVVMVLLLSASTIAFVMLILTLRDKAIPAMEELTATLKRVRGTTEFMSEEAVKPVINAAGKAAQVGAAFRVFRMATKRRW